MLLTFLCVHRLIRFDKWLSNGPIFVTISEIGYDWRNLWTHDHRVRGWDNLNGAYNGWYRWPGALQHAVNNRPAFFCHKYTVSLGYFPASHSYVICVTHRFCFDADKGPRYYFSLAILFFTKMIHFSDGHNIRFIFNWWTFRFLLL